MSLLAALGYERVRAYDGGMKEWQSLGSPVEHGAPERAGATSTLPTAPGWAGLPGVDPRWLGRRSSAPAPEPRRRRRRIADAGGRIVRLIDAIAALSVGQILGVWLGMGVVCAAIYWLASCFTESALLEGGQRLRPGLGSLWTSLYFSCITATSVGYGDVTPLGYLRIIAMLEATAGLLIFGFVISKFLGRRQERLVEEIHRISYEDRLDRVQSNLHFVLSELQSLAAGCADPTHAPPRTLARLESAVTVFVGELRTIHDLLYRPQETPDEQVLEGILANLKTAFEELLELVRCLGPRRSPLLERNLAATTRLASEICGECVPRQYAPDLKALMDDVQRIAGAIAHGTTRSGA